MQKLITSSLVANKRYRIDSLLSICNFGRLFCWDNHCPQHSRSFYTQFEDCRYTLVDNYIELHD